jgi:vesicle-fusing ATPase
MEDMEMLSAFTSVLHVPNLSSPEHLLSVLEESDVFSKHDIKNIGRQIHGKRFIYNLTYSE